jgi:uncharacterized phage-associated protein
MPYAAKSVANFFLDLAEQRGVSLDPMKLQKLVYYARGWYAGYTGQPLINESVEAWTYGPVVPSLYDEFRRFGARTIRGRAQLTFSDDHPVPPPDDERVRSFLREVMDAYGNLSGIRLSEMTHAVDGPWDQTRRAHPGIRSVDIPFSLIRDHFASAVAKTKTPG